MLRVNFILHPGPHILCIKLAHSDYHAWIFLFSTHKSWNRRYIVTCDTVLTLNAGISKQTLKLLLLIYKLSLFGSCRLGITHVHYARVCWRKILNGHEVSHSKLKSITLVILHDYEIKIWTLKQLNLSFVPCQFNPNKVQLLLVPTWCTSAKVTWCFQLL